MLTDEEIWAALECVHAPVKAGFKMFATRGTNLIAVGFDNGVLRCAFAGKDGAKFWRYPGVPEETKDKLIRSPFPDKLFSQLVRNKFKGTAESA